MKHYSKILSVPKREQDSIDKIDHEIHNIGTFIKTGLFTLSVIMLSAIAIVQSQHKMNTSTQQAANVNIIHNKKLPIYCVDRKEKVVALSFDAAWAEVALLKHSNLK